MKALGLFSTPIVAVFALLFGVVVILAPNDLGAGVAAAASTCSTADSSSVAEIDMDDQQLTVAHTIIDVGKSLRVPARGWVIALAAGMQESGLRPLGYGDRDSLGVFQQRAAWGSAADRIDPKTSARMFFTGGQAGQRGLLDIPGWQSMPVTGAAQAVQVSAFPDAYAKWEQLAVNLVATLADVDSSCQPAGTWTNPLGNARYVLTASFGQCGSSWADCHTGQDFAIPTGTPIRAAGGGTVTFAGWAGPYGNTVRVMHPGGIATWYCHLSRIEVRRDAQVTAGQLVGLSGSTGNSTGPHLHLEIRTGASSSSSGTPIDPLPWLRNQNVL